MSSEPCAVFATILLFVMISELLSLRIPPPTSAEPWVIVTPEIVKVPDRICSTRSLMAAASMIVLEAAFGLSGLVAAPIYAAWLARELREGGWV